MDARKAVSLALSFIDGMRAAGGHDETVEATAFLEHLAGQGFVIRPREGAEWRRAEPSSLEARSLGVEEIRVRREALGLSIAALAIKAGVSRSMIRQMERGRTMPHARTLAAVLDALVRAQAAME